MGNVLCDGSPHTDDPRLHLDARQWETSMMHSGCNNLAGCCLAMFCPPCFACYLRKKALNDDMSKYSCCQGYINCCCCPEAIPMQDSCPEFCLCLEVFCCESCAISATRIYVQEERQIQTDPCDNRIIRFNNCMQVLSFICHILAVFDRNFRQLAQLVDLIADIVYCLTQACMQAQTHHELTLHPTVNDYNDAGKSMPSAPQQHHYSDTSPLVRDQPPPY